MCDNTTNTNTDTTATTITVLATENGCSLCSVQFEDKDAKRAHMKDDWQKRRGLEELEDKATSSSSSEEEPSSATDSETSDQEDNFSAIDCLFCPHHFSDLEQNLHHMSTTHSFFIPSTNHHLDTSTFLLYLHSLVSTFNECLFCGSIKKDRDAVQAHMQAKGHCRVDFEDPEIREFYDFEEGALDEESGMEGKEVVHEDGEMRLQSGKILGHRGNPRQSRGKRIEKAREAQPNLLEDSAEPPDEHLEASPLSSSTALTRTSGHLIRPRPGTSTSLIGVPELQQRALIAMEKSVLRAESGKKNEYQHGLEKRHNRQKRFRVKSMGKKQGGLEKRLG